MHRFPLIDGLRLLAAGLVLLSHVAFWTGASGIDVSGPLLARGDSGVAIFFAISAFLLLRPWLTADDQRRIDLRQYAIHRAARILPAYWAALSAVFLVLWLRTGSLGSGWDVLSHIVLLQGYTGADYQAFTQTWSLTTEVTFYAVLPLLGPALAHVMRRSVRTALLAVSGIGIVGLLLQALATGAMRSGIPTWPGVLATSVAGHAAWFAVGALGAVLSTPAGRDWLARQHWSRRVGEGCTTGTLAISAAIVYVLVSLPWAGPTGLQIPTVSQSVVKELGYALLAALLLAAATRPAGDAAGHQVRRSPALRTAGDLSYAVFLWHVLVLQVLYLVADWPLFSGGFGWMLFAVVTVTALVAYASMVLIERPALARWTRTPVVRRPTPQPAERE